MSRQGRITRRGLLGAAAAASAMGLASRAGPARAAPRSALAGPEAQLPGRRQLVIRNAYVLTMDPALGDFERGDVHLRNGTIVAVGPDLDAPGAEVIDGRNMIALPGLVDTHWHLWNSAYRGVVGEGPELGYFPVGLRLGRVASPEDNYRGVRLGLAEALYSGITTVHNWSHNVRGPQWADAELRAHREVGLRARYSYGTPQGIAPDRLMDVIDLARVRQQYFSTPGDGLLTLGVASRGSSAFGAANTANPEVLRREWATARDLSLPITMHASRAGYGETFARDGLLGPDVQFVHGLDLTAADRAAMAAAGTHLSSSPMTELRTLLGFPPILDMLDAGVLTSLSIDTTAISANADMFAAMRTIVDLAHAQAKDAEVLPPRRALELATIDGARDLGLDDKIGSLTPGKRADLILVRALDLNIAPVVDAPNALVHAAQPHNVDTVIVDGRILKRGGQLVALDAEQVSREAAESLAVLRARAGGP
jgi:cytosine/adenosine deaminase-related metal-dependent hydrolase